MANWPTQPLQTNKSGEEEGNWTSRGAGHLGSCVHAVEEFGKEIFYGIYARISAYMSC